MDSNLGVPRSNSLAMTAYFSSWNDAIISYILLIPCLMLFLFQILQNFHLTFCEETPIISFIKAKCNFMKEKSKSQTVAERRWAVRTVLSKIEFRSGEGRGCNLSGSGRYPGNEAVVYNESSQLAQNADDPAFRKGYSELRWHHASSYDIRTPVLMKGREFF